MPDDVVNGDANDGDGWSGVSGGGGGPGRCCWSPVTLESSTVMMMMTNFAVEDGEEV